MTAQQTTKTDKSLKICRERFERLERLKTLRNQINSSKRLIGSIFDVKTENNITLYHVSWLEYPDEFEWISQKHLLQGASIMVANFEQIHRYYGDQMPKEQLKSNEGFYRVHAYVLKKLGCKNYDYMSATKQFVTYFKQL